MPGRMLMLIGLLVIAGCAPTAPQSAEPETVEPTVDIPATVAAVVAEQTGAALMPTPTAVVPAAAPTTAAPAAATPAPRTANNTSDPLRSAPEAVPVQGAVSSMNDPGGTVHPSEAAHALTGGLLMSFTHSLPEYTDWVRGAFLYIEDKQFCEAASRFKILAKEAQDHFGERLTSATYNAGVAYMAFGWEPHNRALCTVSGTSYPVAMLATPQLEKALPHLRDDQYRAAAHLMLGRANANIYIVGLTGSKRGAAVSWVGSGFEEDAVKATEHLCHAVNLDREIAEAAQTILVELDRSC